MADPGAESGETLSVRRVHTGRVINLDIDRVRFPNGSEGTLEMIRHPGASAVVPFTTAPNAPDARVLLVRQYRYAARSFIYEIPAGRLDAGEDPRHCAERELKEETGCTAETVAHVFTMYTTPGFTDERIHVFVASGLTRGETAHEADEFISVVEMPLRDALELVHRGEIPDAKTALSLLFVARFPTPAAD